mgnify:CR=1 FL=1
MGYAINAWCALLKKDPEFLLVGTIRDFFYSSDVSVYHINT